jgi:DNA-binding NtrC family response regulator
MDEKTAQQTLSELRPQGAPSAPPRPFLFVAMECARPLAGGARYALADADEIHIGRGSTRKASRSVDGRTRRLSIAVPDARMSQDHARLVAHGGGHVLEDRGSRNGTKVNGRDVTASPLNDGDLLQIGRTLLVYRRALAAPEVHAHDVDSDALAPRLPGMRTLTPALAAQLDALARVARSEASVLVVGETGTGKELLARAVHRLGRPEGPFVGVNCGAIPTGLVESQLFGHVRGAFSGALRDEPGFVRAAAGGTLFLDEVGDLPRPSQAAFLRVLQEREVVAVGATRPVAVDVRVVSATHAPLEELVAEGEFREDLFARLSGFVFRAPALRDRREDIGIVVTELLTRLAPTRQELTFDPEAARALFSYAWPRNVRELEQALTVALALAGGDSIGRAHLPEAVVTAGASVRAAPASLDAEGEALRRELIAQLEAHAGNVAAVSRAMGRARPLVHRWLKRFHLDPEVFRGKR